MKESYIGYAGFCPQEQSDIMIRLKALAAEIYKEHVYADYILRQMFPSTATGEYLDRHAEERGLSRKQATKAHSTVSFFAAEEEHEDILIPAGTVVCTYTDMHRYTTDSAVILHANEERVLAPITAVAAGAEYNARGGTVTIIVTPVQGVGRVYNGSLVVGGTDRESDEELRARVLDSYANISNGTNAAYYKSLAMSVSGVASASVVGCARGAGTVDVYVLGDGEDVTSEQLAEVQTLLSQERELNVNVRACRPTELSISVFIYMQVEAGYEFNTVAGEVQTAVTDFINHLGLGRNVLLSEIGDVIYHIMGVSNFRFAREYGADCIVLPSQYACAQSIVIREG